MILPIYDPYDDTWCVENSNGMFSTLTQKEYEEWLIANVQVSFRTRYGVVWPPRKD